MSAVEAGARAVIPPVRVVFDPADRREVLARIDRCLATGQVAQGPNVEEFEARFAGFVGARHAVALSSGGSAIEAAMRALGVEGREVLVPTNTFAATAFGVMLAGGRVRLVDADPATLGVRLDDVRAARTAATAGVVVVHVGGIITPEIGAIRDWCAAEGLWLFEDAAHAHGSVREGVAAGRWGVAGAYSFFSTKVVTSGEGGMLVTDDDELAARVRRMRDYGKPDPWVTLSTSLGANWRMAEFCAAVGCVQMSRLPGFVDDRARVAAWYAERLRGTELELVLPDHPSSGYKFVVLVPRGVSRDAVRAAMEAEGVRPAGGVYDVPLHRQPVFAGVGGRFPAADDVCGRHLCLPIYPGLDEGDVERVVGVLRGALDRAGAP